MKKKIFFISIFIFFLLIFFLSPISGDDWGNYIEGSRGLYKSITEAIGMYFSWEGRFISRILINILTYHKILWNIVNSVVITGTIFLIIKIINPKKKIIYLLSLLVFLLMNIYTFSQVVPWLAGNITYLFPIPLLLLYFYFIFSNKKDKKLIILYSILNLLMTMFVEHMAIILIFSNILFIIYRYIKNKKLDKELILYLIISIIGTVTMLLSPGTLYRSSVENLEFNKLSIIGKLLYNIPNFIYYTFIVNPYMIILLSISSTYLINKIFKNKIVKILLILAMNLIPILSTSLYVISKFININSFLLDSSSTVLIIFYILYVLFFIYLIIKNYKTIFNKEMFFFVIGISSNVVMMASPTWGFRTSLGTYIFLCIFSLLVMNEYIKERKIYNYIASFIIIICSLFYIILYISTYRQYKENKILIEKGINDKSKIIEIYGYPHFANCNINPEDDYHLIVFKRYYNIDEDVEVKVLKNKWRYLIFY